ncbi:MAG: serine/threonine protein kinase [Thermoguttaceae bacterium]|nr:serine/threonine protein kinase [Thermoguttaceae bacterium]
MSNEQKQLDEQKEVIDEKGYKHIIPPNSKIASGGQGVVYRTTDKNLAIKQPLKFERYPDWVAKYNEVFSYIRTLPLPKGIHISFPIACLRDEPGYVMRLLNDMNPFSIFFKEGNCHNAISKDNLPDWLSQIQDKDFAQELAYYAETGSTRFRLYALYKCASILARLHNAGIVYGDISDNNVFIEKSADNFVGKDIPCDSWYIDNETSCNCWLIDADNLCLESFRGGNFIYTPTFGAPELVQGKAFVRPRTDCWAFAVMAFRILTLYHPFIGKMVEEGHWSKQSISSDITQQAYAGYLPYIDDEQDKSNSARGKSFREVVLNSPLRTLFQETFGAGRLQPHRRPSMSFWALELARAFDNSIVCPHCKMSYFNAPVFEGCPYCEKPRPAFVIAKTDRWQMNLFDGNKVSFQKTLPHRLFHPFSLTSGGSEEYIADINWESRTVKHALGTDPFPPGLKFEFVGSIEQD